MHLINRGFVKGYTSWSHHGEAVSTSLNADMDTGYDEVGGENADENNHVMIDDELTMKIEMAINQMHHRWMMRNVMSIHMSTRQGLSQNLVFWQLYLERTVLVGGISAH
jgi:hypothetical protein